MSTQKRLFACAAVLFGGLCSAFALIGIRPVLTNAVWSGDQFQFTLQGETNVAYILESSSDLRIWTPAVTNSDSQETRTVVVPATSSQTFWRVRPVPGALFEYAILAQGFVNLFGSGTIDSFDSADPNFSTNGLYDPIKRKAGGDIATAARTVSAIDVGTMIVAGTVSTGPGGTVRIANSGSVGSLAWVTSIASKGLIEPGYHKILPGLVFPAAGLPRDFAPAALPQNVLYPPVGGTNYNYAILADGDYRHFSNISLGSGQKMLINARCRIHVTGNTAVASSAYILLGPNASVEWYANGTVSLGGQGCINGSNLARNLSIFGLGTNTVSYSGQVRFVGTIYAPFAPVTLFGTTGAIGAIVSSNFTLTGSMGLHFDESLKSAGPFR